MGSRELGQAVSSRDGHITTLNVLFISNLDIGRSPQRFRETVRNPKGSICCASISQDVFKLVHRVRDDRNQFFFSKNDAAQVKAIEDCEDWNGRLVEYLALMDGT